MAVPATEGSWSFGDTKELVSGIANIYNTTMQAKTAEANATTATQNKSALDSQLNAKTSTPTGLQIDTKTIAIAGGVGVLVIGAIIAFR